MFQNILVITDNVYLADEFEKIIQGHSRIIDSISFGISPSSSKDVFEKKLSFKVEVMDLQDDSMVEKIIKENDLVFSIHCKQIFPPQLVEACKCINVHPGYNPYNRGWYPQVFAILEDLPIGATIHEIDDKLDHGNIIARELVPKYNYDTSLDLYTRVLKKEIELLERNLENILHNNYLTLIPEEEGQVRLKRDFNNLLYMDLEENGTFKSFIDKLRALSHGNYRNAYFLDPETGKKVFLHLSLTIDNGNDS